MEYGYKLSNNKMMTNLIDKKSFNKIIDLYVKYNYIKHDI